MPKNFLFKKSFLFIGPFINLFVKPLFNNLNARLNEFAIYLDLFFFWLSKLTLIKLIQSLSIFVLFKFFTLRSFTFFLNFNLLI
jgi:hypothetical protein